MPNGPGKEPSRSNVVVTHVTASGTIHLEPKPDLRPPRAPAAASTRPFWLLGIVAALALAGLVFLVIHKRGGALADVRTGPSASAAQAPVASVPSASSSAASSTSAASAAPVASAPASASASPPPRPPRPRTPKRR